MADFALDELEQMSRKDLQALAKRNGIKANLKSAAIIDLLVEYWHSCNPQDKENNAASSNTEPEVVTNTPEKVEQAPKQEDEAEQIEAQTPVEPMDVVPADEEKTKEKSTPEPSVATPKKKKKQPVVSPSPIRRTLPKNPVPPSPMQKFSRNASSALTPRKTPMGVAMQTPAKDSYIITPRKNKNKKNLFTQTPTPKREQASTFEVAPFADFQTSSLAVNPHSLYLVLNVLSREGILLADQASVVFVANLLSALTQSIVKQAMRSEGVVERRGFVLKRSSLVTALSSVLTGELAKHAVLESEAIRTRYQDLGDEEVDANLMLGLTIDHNTLREYLAELEAQPENRETLFSLAACLEYVSAEIWELADKKEFDEFQIVQLDAVFEAINEDDELNFTFKKQVEKESSKPACEFRRSIPGSRSGATPQAIKRLETALRFSLPQTLRSFLVQRDGDSRLGVDSCDEIEASNYTEISIVYSLLNWIPIRSHRDGDFYDCYDACSGIVLRASLLPSDEGLVNPGKYPVLASSFEEYIEKHIDRADETFLDATATKTLKEVNPLLADIADFWINITEEEL